MPRHRKAATPPENRHRTQPAATPAEMYKRRQLVRNLILRSASNDEIWAAFEAAAQQGQLLPVNEVQLRRLIQEAKAALESELTDTTHIERHKMKQRLHGHIAKAAAKGQWAAVMQGERLLAEITGVMAPIKIHATDTTQAFTTALGNALAVMTPEQLQALLAGEEIPLPAVVETTAANQEEAMANGA